MVLLVNEDKIYYLKKLIPSFRGYIGHLTQISQILVEINHQYCNADGGKVKDLKIIRADIFIKLNI